ncbi:DUF29 domain-containing protein [Sphaerospermopsis sp. LEGE 00249]|uniref:DUF29 domain-containing protein n=1 Tax=Sphaerospermopsis sp. LEGE 00249 TaxID=1380707 RepID=UPI00164E6F9A|nr:DUF29 domain-containing protein [Sphaerospermopsis sp. LEGE 00249]MBC5795825.1 DUF29 domain-containing protein [Sphaerospermopsis sp. LEGE 00249]
MKTESKLTLYETDYQEWIETTLQHLREQNFHQLDLEHLIEEIEAMGKSDKRELQNRLIILLMHLLKWKYQPANQSSSWLATIDEQRRQILFIFEDSPSLEKNFLATISDKCYQMARKSASKETKLPLGVFPESCPFCHAEIFDLDFYP